MIVEWSWFVRAKGRLFGVEATATTIGPFLFVVEGTNPNSPEVLHERIHLAQWKELYYVGFPVVFWAIYLWRMATIRNAEAAYLHHPMEAEAFRMMDTPGYLAYRRPFAWAHLD